MLIQTTLQDYRSTFWRKPADPAEESSALLVPIECLYEDTWAVDKTPHRNPGRVTRHGIVEVNGNPGCHAGVIVFTFKVSAQRVPDSLSNLTSYPRKDGASAVYCW